MTFIHLANLQPTCEVKSELFEMHYDDNIAAYFCNQLSF